MNYHLLSIINWLEQHQLPCIVKKITGFDCPGCGFQRSSIALLKGDVGESFRIYPALIPILLLFVLLGLHLLKKLPNGVGILKFTYIFTTIIILASYIHKLINH